MGPHTHGLLEEEGLRSQQQLLGALGNGSSMSHCTVPRLQLAAFATVAAAFDASAMYVCVEGCFVCLHSRGYLSGSCCAMHEVGSTQLHSPIDAES